jgi:hypothetical protein
MTVAECSSVWKDCPASCFSAPESSKGLALMSDDQAVARRLAHKLIGVAEALRRTSTYCEINHLNKRCDSVSPKSSAFHAGGTEGEGAEESVTSREQLKTCAIFDKESNSSPWNPPFSISEALVQNKRFSSSYSRAEGDITRQARQFECPTTCAQDLDRQENTGKVTDPRITLLFQMC